MMLTIVVLAILLALAVPAFTNIIGKNRLKSAAERMSTELQFARSSAIAQNQQVRVHVSPGSSWCMGLDDDLSTDCDCAGAPAQCTIDGQQQVVTSGDFENIEITGSTIAGDAILFDNVRGLPDGGGDVDFENEDGKRVRLRFSLLGSVNLCSPTGSGHIGDYVDCP